MILIHTDSIGDLTLAPRPHLSCRRSSVAALGAFALGLALLLGTTGAAGAAALPAAHTLATSHRHASTASRRVFAPLSSRSVAVLPATPFLLRARFLPAHAASQAQHSIAELVTAWQKGLYRHSATRPVAAWRTLQRQVQQITEPGVSHGDSVHDAIYQASVRWGVSYYYLVRLATCESGLNPGAYNPSGASGLFQFMPGTYYGWGSRIGEGRSLWNAYGSANVAAYMISIGQAHQWTCSYYI